MRILNFLRILPTYIQKAWFISKFPHTFIVVHGTKSYKKHKIVEKQLWRAADTTGEDNRNLGELDIKSFSNER